MHTSPTTPRVMVRYRVRPDRVEENVAYVEAVYAALADLRPDGFRYATYRQDDGVTFVHLASYQDPFPLSGVAAFQEFQAGLIDRCDEPPVRVELDEVGSYHGGAP